MRDNPSFCIHAHFYQPPRKDPFIKEIPDEPGASPYRNWNERILDTCYKPNAELRNFSRISFNMGPTLTKWMSEDAPEVLERIVSEDELNKAIYGVGNAIAQPYNHSILPLAKAEDKRTQVKWGITAFESLFDRHPEGMWLPETAVDLETLSVLEENDIQFTILAPWQVHALEGESPYRIDLGGGRSIIAFVYHGGLSSSMSFDTFATGNADAFAEFYLKPEIQRENQHQLLLIATDGELYGHHQPFRDKFLARLLDGAANGIGIKPTYPALWLRQNPVTGKARIIENTSWSCHHGVERWKGECGCTPGNTWKEPLRQAFDLLDSEIAVDFYRIAREYSLEPYQARDQYIRVVLGELEFKDWLTLISRRELSIEEYKRLSMLFDAQYACQQMFTSCGWFFDELSRIEPRNNIAYAAHAARLMENITGKDFHTRILPLLKEVVSDKTGLTAADYFLTSYSRFSDI
jgi:alpha-amylase/alpha-mannosidase (GH57 family)